MQPWHSTLRTSFFSCILIEPGHASEHFSQPMHTSSRCLTATGLQKDSITQQGSIRAEKATPEIHVRELYQHQKNYGSCGKTRRSQKKAEHLSICHHVVRTAQECLNLAYVHLPPHHVQEEHHEQVFGSKKHVIQPLRRMPKHPCSPAASLRYIRHKTDGTNPSAESLAKQYGDSQYCHEDHQTCGVYRVEPVAIRKFFSSSMALMGRKTSMDAGRGTKFSERSRANR